MIRADGVRFAVRGRALLDGFSARFEEGLFHVVAGANGAGKSTLLKVLSGQLRPAAGEVRYGDSPIHDFSPRELARRRAVLSQGVEIAFPLRVHEVVRMGRYPHALGSLGPADERACEEVIELLDLQALVARDVLTLSGGERQRVHFARVLAQLWTVPNAILFLDEPLTFLDVRHQIDLLRRLGQLKSRMLVVGVLHDLNLAARFADRVMLLLEGKLVADGSPQEVLTAANVDRVFGVRPRVVEGDRPALIFD